MKPKPLQFVSFQNAELISIQNDTISLSVTGNFFNPNRYAAKIENLEYTFFVDNEVAGFGQFLDEQQIPSKEEFQLTVPLTLTKDELDVWKGMLLEKDTVELKIISKVKVKAGLYHKNVKSTTKKNLAIKEKAAEWIQRELTKFQPKVGEIHFESIGLLKQRVAADVNYHNPYPFDLQIDSLSVDVKINQVRLGSITVNEPLKLVSGKTVTTSYRLDISTFLASGIAMAGVVNKTLQYEMTGSARIGMASIYLKVPIKINGTYEP